MVDKGSGEATCLGVAALEAQPGDYAYMLPGLHAPAVLRHKGTSDDGERHRFQFMGA